jgi:D-tyrosyl-tRNA(Tyr) deacylase
VEITGIEEGSPVRALVQTVSRASVTVDGEVVGAVTDGLLVLIGVTHNDTAATAEAMARKTYELRILDGEASASDIGAPLLVVSQFTLYGDARKGRRPTWSAAAPAERAEPLVTAFVDALRARGATVQTGRFRTHMLVESVNVGPHTVMLEM